MTGDLAALIIITLLSLLLVLKKTHVAVITMALCGGYVLSDRVSFSLSQSASWLTDHNNIPVYTIFKLILLFGPPVFVAMHFRGTQHGGGRFVEQLVPALALSLLVIVFILEQLSFATREFHLDNSVILNQIWLFSPWIVISAFVTALFDLSLQKNKTKRHHSSRKKH